MNVHGIIFPYGGTNTPSILMRIKCRLVYGSHLYMTPNNDTRSWCGRCGLLHSFVPMPVQNSTPKLVEVPPDVMQALMKEMLLPGQIVPIKKIHTPPPVRVLNQTIKDNVVWLVDEYRKRKGIEPHVLLDVQQFDEFIDSIVELVMQYEGVYHHAQDDDEEEEGSGKTA